MMIPQMLSDIVRLLMQLFPAMALLSLLLAGIALRLEGGSTFLIGGSFTKWMLWAIIMMTMPQLLLWFSFFGLPLPATAGTISTSWLAGIGNDVSIFINSFVIGRLTLALAAYFIVRAVLDASDGNNPLASVLASMFLLAIPATANLINNLQTDTRFSAADVIDGIWNYLAGRIMPIAAGLAVIGAIFNFVTHRPALRLIACAIGFLTLSALWRLILQMM